MKKIFGLTIMVLAIALFPTIARAEEKVTWVCASDHEAELLAGRTSSCDFYVSAPASGKVITKVEGSVILTDLDVVEVTKAANWDGTYNKLTGAFAYSHNGVSTKQKMFTVTFKLSASASGAKCGTIDVSINRITEGTPDDPKNPEDPKNPPTGSAVPYVLVGTGIVLAGAALYVSKKNKKVYNV